MARRLLLVSALAGAAFALGAPGIAAGGGCYPGPRLEMTSSERSHVSIEGCAFVDTVTYVDPGEKVTWTNEEAVPHSVTGAALSWGDEDYLDEGEEVSYRFDDPGVYPYYCALHPTMVGAVVVGDGKSAAALTNGKAAVEDVDRSALAAASGDDTPAAPPSDGSSEVVVALAVVVGLGAALYGSRSVLRRRSASAPAP